MGNYGMKVSQEGYDAKTADDINLILKTDITMLKVFASGTISSSPSGWFEITHNLGYIPQFLTYTKNTFGGDKVYLGTAAWSYAVARADTTKLYILPKGTGSIAYYYIFYEQA